MWNKGVFLMRGILKSLLVFSIGWETVFHSLAILQHCINNSFLFAKLIWNPQIRRLVCFVKIVYSRSGYLQVKNLNYFVSSLDIFIICWGVEMSISLDLLSSWILYFTIGFCKRKWSPLWRRSLHSWGFF